MCFHLNISMLEGSFTMLKIWSVISRKAPTKSRSSPLPPPWRPQRVLSKTGGVESFWKEILVKVKMKQMTMIATIPLPSLKTNSEFTVPPKKQLVGRLYHFFLGDAYFSRARVCLFQGVWLQMHTFCCVFFVSLQSLGCFSRWGSCSCAWESCSPTNLQRNSCCEIPWKSWKTFCWDL